MRAYFAYYVEIEKQIIETLGSSSKNLIARETARLINLHEASEGKNQLINLIKRIRKLTV